MTDQRQIVLVDVDEVLFPFAHGYDQWLVRERGVGLEAELMRRYEIAAAAGDGHREHAVRFVNDPETLAIPPVAGATAAIGVLASRYRLVACTTRFQELESQATRAWLDRHLPGFDDVVCTRARPDAVPTAKAAVAAHFMAIALIDDTEANLEGLPDHCRGLLLTRPPGLDSHESAVTWDEAIKELRD